jgi:hypothetical protein
MLPESRFVGTNGRIAAERISYSFKAFHNFKLKCPFNLEL